MLYSEFVENTGCKETDYNYQVYKRLEILYMNCDDITKAEIYEYGRKLVDNSLTPEQIAWNEDIDRQIAEQETYVKYYKDEIKSCTDSILYWKDYDADMVKSVKKSRQWARQQLAMYRNNIKNLKSSKYTA